MAAFATHLHHRRHITAILNAIAQVDLPQLGLQLGLANLAAGEQQLR